MILGFFILLIKNGFIIDTYIQSIKSQKVANYDGNFRSSYRSKLLMLLL